MALCSITLQNRIYTILAREANRVVLIDKVAYKGAILIKSLFLDSAKC